MIEHLSSELTDRYCQRLVEPPELLALDQHLATCADCRRQLRAALSLAAVPGILQASLLAHRGADEHPPIDQLRSYLAERLDAVDRELAGSHLEFCAHCQSQVAELRSAQQRAKEADAPASGATERKAPETWLSKLVTDWQRIFSQRLPLRLAGAMAVLALLIWGITHWRSNTANRQEIAQTPPTPTPKGNDRLPQPAPDLLLALNDGGSLVTLDTKGNLTGIESLDAAEQQSIKTALSTGQIETPKTLAELKSKATTLMGGTDADPARVWAASSNTTLLSPFAEVIAEDRPTMRWKPLAGAESYAVTISDTAANYREIIASPEMTTTHWRITRTLPRGRLYAWQVTAFLKDIAGQRREITAPAPEAAEARFRLLAQTEADELAQCRQTYAGRHLPLGLLYARMGLLKEAERELQALIADNTQEPVAQELLRDVRGKRKSLQQP